MRQNVAMDDEPARIVDEAAAKLEIAINSDRSAIALLRRDAGGDRENVPPDPV